MLIRTCAWNIRGLETRCDAGTYPLFCPHIFVSVEVLSGALSMSKVTIVIDFFSRVLLFVLSWFIWEPVYKGKKADDNSHKHHIVASYHILMQFSNESSFH